MATESVEEFLARGGKVEKSNKETTLNDLLYNEGLLDHSKVEEVKSTLDSALKNSLDKEFEQKK
jgi:hypothetical protein